MTTKKRPRGKPRTVTTKNHLLNHGFERYGSWHKFAEALGYTGPGQLYKWIREPKTFTADVEQKVADVLEGKTAAMSMRANGRGHDKGDMGLAIILAPLVANGDDIAITKAMDVADAMGGRAVFRKKTDLGWLVIYRFVEAKDLGLFKTWCKGRVDVTTP